MIKLYKITDEDHCKECGNAIDRDRSFWAKHGLCEACGPAFGRTTPELQLVKIREIIRRSEEDEGMRTLKFFDII